MASWTFDAAQKRYMLRRTLFPWKPRETIQEVTRYVKRFGIDEVMWKIDTEEFSHGLPTLERIREYLPWLCESRRCLSEAGASMSINPWVTMGMRDAGLDMRPVHPDFEFVVDASGTAARATACPLSPGWRRWICEAYRLYASTEPRVLWIEDDIRIHGHRPVMWACFCERHLEQFSRRMGRSFMREQLVAEVLAPGEPTEVRRQWLAFLGEGVLEAVRQIAQAVYGEHPRVQLGLMTSAPWLHAMECRDWDAMLAAVAGPHEVVTLRPCMGNYQEASPRGLYDSRVLVSGTLAAVRRPAHPCTEVENWPFTRFAKSVRFTRAQVLLSAALRCPSVTFNLYDHVGSSLFDEPAYGEMLQAERPRMDALAQAYGPEGVERGPAMLIPERGGMHKRLDAGAGYGELSMSRPFWADTLQALGFGVSFSGGPVLATTGQNLLACAGELDALFAGGVLLDLSAVETLTQIGRTDLIGATIAETFKRGERATPAEAPCDPAFGEPDAYMTVDHLGLRARVGRYEPTKGARVVSHLIDPDRQPVQPGFVLFENALGGRVALCPYDMQQAGPPHWFLNWRRQRQMLAILRWLHRDRLPLHVTGGAYALPIRTDYTDAVLVSVLNLSLDDWPRFEVTLADLRFAPQRAELLNARGQWESMPADALREGEAGPGSWSMALERSLASLDMVTVRLH